MSTEKFNEMINAIQGGKSLVIVTRLRSWRVTAKNLLDWEKAGRSLLKHSTPQGGFYIARGKSFDYVAPGGCAVYFE